MISSLEALRRLTKPGNQSSDPIEGFQQYLDSKSSSVKKLNSVQIFRRGAGFGKLRQILACTNSKRKEKFLKIWKFETIREALESDRDFIESQISFLLCKALMAVQHSHLRVLSKNFYLWKSTQSLSSPIPLIFKLQALYMKRKKFALNKLYFKQNEKTRLIFFIINHLLGVIRRKFLLWKRQSDKVSTELQIVQKNAVLNFREFQRLKIIELISSYRKSRQLFLKKSFFKWTLIKKKQEIKHKEESKKVEKDGVTIKKLKRQKEKHEDAVTEANIKLQLVDMMLKLMNNIYKD